MKIDEYFFWVSLLQGSFIYDSKGQEQSTFCNVTLQASAPRLVASQNLAHVKVMQLPA